MAFGPSSVDALHRSFLVRRHFASLDGLRAISIVPVVWHHSTPRPYDGLLGRGPIGVDLFFAISGFLITTLLIREREKYGSVDLPAFYARRSFRIFPLYYLVFALHLAFARFVRPDWGPSRNFVEQAPYYATYTANWLVRFDGTGPVLFVFAWSLCAEEQFYGFWAPVLRYCRRLVVAAAFMACWLSIDLGLEYGWLGGAAFRASLPCVVVTSFAAPIGLGALLALAAHDPTIGPWVLRVLGRRHSSTAVMLLAVSLVVVPWAEPPVLHLLLSLLVLSCSLRSDHGMARVLDHGIMSGIGRISYGTYLWHVPVIGFVRAVAPELREHALWTFGVALPLSLMVAAVSYRYFERPFLGFGANFRRMKSSRTDARMESSRTDARTEERRGWRVGRGWRLGRERGYCNAFNASDSASTDASRSR